MSTEHIIVKDQTFQKVQSAVNKMVDLIKPTFGPASNKVIIDKFPYKMIVDDGVQIARDFELDDPVENSIVRIIRETAVKTNDRAGDGTTGSLIILQALINEIAKKSRFDGRKIELELKKGLEELKENLKKSAKQIKTKEDIRKVSLISFDDEEIAELIADLYHELGKDAVITIDKSQTMETTVEKSAGLTIDHGYISPYMVTNPERMETELEKPYILITDYRLTEAEDLMPIMNLMAKEQKTNLLVIAENVEQKALATLIVNLPHVVNPETNKRGGFMSVAVNAPKGSDKKTFLEDLALMTGATFFTESKGSKLENATVKDLGRSKKAIIRREETIIADPLGDKATIATAISSLKVNADKEKDEKKKAQINKRLARITNKMATIKVGAVTENEQKALKYKIEDAISSVRLALKSGVVAGSGLSLYNIETSSSLLNDALKYPARQLRENVGCEEDIKDLKQGHALNVVTGKTGPFLDVGVVDPVDAIIAGAESAVSIASVLVTCKGMIIEKEKDNKKE